MSYLLILCCALIHMSLAGSDIFLYHVFGLTGTTIIFGCKAVTYLLYPLLGWMADVCFTRYKFVLFSFIAMILCSIPVAIESGLSLRFPLVNEISIFLVAELSFLVLLQ